MAISQDLQDRYTSEVDIDWRYAFAISHPRATTRYLINGGEEHQGYVNGTLQTFIPVPVQVTPPARDSSGNSDMQLTWDGIGGAALEFLYEALQDGTLPITCKQTIYLMEDPEPKVDPWLQFRLVDVTVQDLVVTATASRSNIINKPFPKELYRLINFPGLRRR